jgi:hypothetical protein
MRNGSSGSEAVLAPNLRKRMTHSIPWDEVPLAFRAWLSERGIRAADAVNFEKFRPVSDVQILLEVRCLQVHRGMGILAACRAVATKYGRSPNTIYKRNRRIRGQQRLGSSSAQVPAVATMEECERLHGL